MTQTSSLKSKMIFEVYQFLLNMKNKFLFQSVLSLYDYTLLRNNEIVYNKEINIRNYLTGDYDIMEENLKEINKVYRDYTEDAIRQNYNSVQLEDVLKRTNLGKDIGAVYNVLPLVNNMLNGASFAREVQRPFVQLRTRSRGKSSASVIKDKGEEGQGTDLKTKRYDFKMIQLNTDFKQATPTDGKHVFFNMLAGDEISTENYQKINIKVISFLTFQALLSNWHYICYMTMILYTFINGGILGFFYSSALIILVLVEEGMPGILFWKMCFINSAIGFSGKLGIRVFAEKLVQVNIMKNSTRAYINNISTVFIGSSSYIFEIFIMIFILIQLILSDELGYKPKGIIDFEDTNTAYIRMKINKIFALRENEYFGTYKLKLEALYKSIKEIDNEVVNKKNIIKSQKKQVVNQTKKNIFSFFKATAAKISERDEIDITEVIEFERSQNNKKTEILEETIKIIEKTIFIKGFGNFSEENKKSFRWKLFSVYVNSV